MGSLCFSTPPPLLNIGGPDSSRGCAGRAVPRGQPPRHPSAERSVCRCVRGGWRQLERTLGLKAVCACSCPTGSPGLLLRRLSQRQVLTCPGFTPEKSPGEQDRSRRRLPGVGARLALGSAGPAAQPGFLWARNPRSPV